MKPENQVRNCWLPTQRMAPGRPTSAIPHQNHATKWTCQKHLRASCTERLSFWIFVIWPNAQPTLCILSVLPLGNWRSGLIERVEEIPPKLAVPAFAEMELLRERRSSGNARRGGALLGQGSQAGALRVFSDQILPSFISSAWGQNFERQGAVQGARHPVRRGRLATLALYS